RGDEDGGRHHRLRLRDRHPPRRPRDVAGAGGRPPDGDRLDRPGALPREGARPAAGASRPRGTPWKPRGGGRAGLLRDASGYRDRVSRSLPAGRSPGRTPGRAAGPEPARVPGRAKDTALNASQAPSASARGTVNLTDPMKDYLSRIGRTALLTAEQEVDLAKRIEAGLFARVRLERL